MLTWMLPVFLAGIILACLSAPLGCLVVWRRMAYLGDTLSHASLLGIALSAVFTFLNPFYGILLSALGVGIALYFLESRINLSNDTFLGIISYASLALGIITLSLTPSFRGDLFAYLFGDILTITFSDLISLIIIGSLIGILLYKHWQRFLMMIIHEDLAASQGISIQKERMLLTLLLALLIALSIQWVGALLVPALLIIPPAAARPFSSTPEQMVAWAAGFGTVALISGLGASWVFDLPAGPMIILGATLLFLLAHFAGGLRCHTPR